MPAAVSPPPEHDDLEALLTFDTRLEDVFNDLNPESQRNGNDQSRTIAQQPEDTLDIFQEAANHKKRQPIPKLDEKRVLSPAGIPKLRKITKERLKFKGKGHEFSDVARLLNTYQLWLDDLYPRAKFTDALIMMEKLGHNKGIQCMRKEWIDEGKPRLSVEEDDVAKVIAPVPAPTTKESTERPGHEDVGTALSAPIADDDGDVEGQEGPDDDEMDALLAQEPSSKEIRRESPQDDLDALLAEEKAMNDEREVPERYKERQHVPEGDDPFADDMEAMADLDDLW